VTSLAEPVRDVNADTSSQVPRPSFQLPDRALDEAPTWPTTRLVSASLTLALGISLFAPAFASTSHDSRWIVLALSAFAVTIATRAVFEVLGFAAAAVRLRRHLPVVVAPALLAGASMTLASEVVGAPWSPAVGVTTFALVSMTLLTAVAARGVEVRFRHALRRVYFIGAAETLRDLRNEIDRRHDSTLVGTTTVRSGRARIRSEDLVTRVLESRATALVLDGHAMRRPELVEAASTLNLAGLRVRDLVSYYEAEFKKVPLAELTPVWFLCDIASIHRRCHYGRVRRGLDVTIAGGLLVLTLPILVAAAIAIRLTSRGPAIYSQRRVGLGGTDFTLLKLRTMRVQSAGSAHASWAGSQAHRVTFVGRLLRRFRLDELPQLWNVVRGDLALIGPRPEQVPIVERLNQELLYYSSRHCIRPGITGWAQVNLGYGGSPNGTVAKLQRDLYYVKHHGPRLDLLIVWLTVKAVLAGPRISPSPALQRVAASEPL
jgi:lipopolysaccharide/colanic/teichoic acid biosynthesis glycosyltransferase